MIWLISYPRSGNTFLRNILFHVYGIKSGAYVKFKELKNNYEDFEFVKTHHLYIDVPMEKGSKVVYLIRDGRDTMVSRAWRKTVEWNVGSEYLDNLKKLSKNDQDKNFGSWSDHVLSWVDHSDVVIRYEDLIADPIGEVMKIDKIRPLPKGDLLSLPTIDSAKKGDVKYKGSMPEKTVRRGVAGSWRDEMPEDIQKEFWSNHKEVMIKMGYEG
jgi:hypothetical protein